MKHLPNRCDLISDLNWAKLEQERILAGRELNKHGAAVEKALSPNYALLWRDISCIEVGVFRCVYRLVMRNCIQWTINETGNNMYFQ